jgi:hypothetical protein
MNNEKYPKHYKVLLTSAENNVPMAGKLDFITTTSKSNCRGAYALTDVNSSYTGPIIKLRRGSDNELINFWADRYGVLWSKSTFDGFTPQDWLANYTITAFVDTWYDQSGMNNHATQTNTSLQPYMNAGDFLNKTMDFRNTRYFNLPDATVPIGSGAYTLLAKHGLISPNTASIVGGGTNGTVNAALTLRRDTSTTYRCWWFGNDHTFSGFQNDNVVAETYDGIGTRTGYVNGTNVSSISMTGRNTTTLNNFIGFSPNALPLNGQLFYVFIFSNELSSSDITTLGTDTTLTKSVNDVYYNNGEFEFLVNLPLFSLHNGRWVFDVESLSIHTSDILNALTANNSFANLHIRQLSNLSSYISRSKGGSDLVLTFNSAHTNKDIDDDTIANALPSYVNFVNTPLTLYFTDTNLNKVNVPQGVIQVVLKVFQVEE